MLCLFFYLNQKAASNGAAFFSNLLFFAEDNLNRLYLTLNITNMISIAPIATTE